MKKFLALFAIIALLCSLACCGLPEPEPIPTTEAAPTTESTTSEELAAKPEKELIGFPQTKPLPEGYSFMSFYAATPTHFYALAGWTEEDYWDRKLVRAPVNSIGRQEDVPLPKEHDGQPLSRPRICGVTPEWLYVCLAKETPGSFNGWVVYRISQETGRSEFITRCDSPAWYNMGSECLLLPYKGRIEALNPSTGESSVLYEAEDFATDGISDIWYTLANGTVALDQDLRIDAANQVKPGLVPEEAIRSIRWYGPQSEAEKALEENENIRTYATCNGQLYYVEQIGWENPRNLYRMKPDGTEKELLRTDTRVGQLLAAGNKLFALAAYPLNEEEDFIMEEILLHELDAKGKPLWNKRCGTEGEENGYGARRFGDMLMVSNYVYGGGYIERLAMLYDPATGQSIEGEKLG